MDSIYEFCNQIRKKKNSLYNAPISVTSATFEFAIHLLKSNKHTTPSTPTNIAALLNYLNNIIVKVNKLLTKQTSDIFSTDAVLSNRIQNTLTF